MLLDKIVYRVVSLIFDWIIWNIWYSRDQVRNWEGIRDLSQCRNEIACEVSIWNPCCCTAWLQWHVKSLIWPVDMDYIIWLTMCPPGRWVPKINDVLLVLVTLLYIRYDRGHSTRRWLHWRTPPSGSSRPSARRWWLTCPWPTWRNNLQSSSAKLAIMILSLGFRENIITLSHESDSEVSVF